MLLALLGGFAGGSTNASLYLRGSGFGNTVPFWLFLWRGCGVVQELAAVRRRPHAHFNGHQRPEIQNTNSNLQMGYL